MIGSLDKVPLKKNKAYYSIVGQGDMSRLISRENLQNLLNEKRELTKHNRFSKKIFNYCKPFITPS